MQLTDDERAHVIQLLNNSQAEFLSLTNGLTDAQWTYRSAPGCWSVGETAEHIVLTEAGLFARMQKALSRPPDLEWEGKTGAKTEFLIRGVPDREQKFEAPVPLRPTSRWTALETIARYQESRARSLGFAKETAHSLKAHLADHPSPVFSTLNAYQWLLYIPLHNMRHNRQIANTRACSEFPR